MYHKIFDNGCDSETEVDILTIPERKMITLLELYLFTFDNDVSSILATIRGRYQDYKLTIQLEHVCFEANENISKRLIRNDIKSWIQKHFVEGEKYNTSTVTKMETFKTMQDFDNKEIVEDLLRVIIARKEM